MASRRETPTGEKEQQGRGGGRQGLHCGEANHNQRRGGKNKTPPETGGGPQVRDPVPIVSVNPEADPPQPRAPVRPSQGEQDGETAEEKSQEHKKHVKGRWGRGGSKRGEGKHKERGQCRGKSRRERERT